jgi:signal transduction histidine kinase
MLKLTLRRRIVLLLVVVAVVPLAVANAIWLFSSQTELKTAAAGQQELLVKNAGDAVTDFLNETVNAAIIHAQTSAVANMQLPEAEPELSAYLKQDSNLTQVALVDANGIQRLEVSPNGISTKTVNVASTNAFRVVTFLGGEDYISPVTFDASHDGYITIAVPLIGDSSPQAGTSLSSSQPGVTLPPSAIKGALIVTLALKELWNSVLNSNLGHAGYAYVVSDQGSLIAYPNTKFAEDHVSLANVEEVRSALTATPGVPGSVPIQPVPRETVSETGVKVLSSYSTVARTGWIVVMEEPISQVYAPVKSELTVAAGFFALSCLVGMLLIMLTARSLLTPIRTLSEGAGRFAKGDLQFRIAMTRGDEFGLLAQTLNDMAAKISATIAKLQDADNLKNEFIFIASHNLRTPLTLINGYVELMKDSPGSGDTLKMIKGIEGSAHELNRFSEEMLTISTIESGYAILNITDISIGELLKPVKLEYDGLAKNKVVTLTWSVPESATVVRLSPVHIRTALANLLRNALEFTPRGGLIDVVILVEPDRLVLSVRDNGSGIEPKEMERLFTKFHRGTSALRYDHPGTGIGLYVTGLIVEAHHGQISVRSQLGHGSTFTITLPVTQATS